MYQYIFYPQEIKKKITYIHCKYLNVKRRLLCSAHHYTFIKYYIALPLQTAIDLATRFYSIKLHYNNNTICTTIL